MFIPDPDLDFFPSRIQRSKKHRIRIPDPQHCFYYLILLCKAVEKHLIRSQKYGADLVHFTHADNTIVYATNREGRDHSLRSVQINIESYLRLQSEIWI
jgi:hypothetical protein